MIKDLLFGLTLPLRSLILAIRTPKLWPWLVLPLLITVVVYYWLWQGLLEPWRVSASEAAANYVAGVFGAESYSTLKSGIKTLTAILLSAVFFIGSIISFGWLANFVSLPVNDFLAQRVEPLCEPALRRAESTGIWHEIRLILIDFKKSLFSALIVIVALSFAWVPIMNIIALIMTSYMLSFQYASYAGTRRGWGIRTTLLKSVPALVSWLSFGAVTSVLLSIPIIGFLAHPLGVIGGTMLFARMENKNNVEQQ